MKLINVIAASVLVFGATSCAMLKELIGDGTVFTTADQLAEGQQGAVIPYDQLPEDIKAKIPEGTTVVLADKEQLKEDAAYIAATPDEGDIGAMIDAGFGIASTFLPGLAAWEGVVTLFSQRKRKHYVKAAKALVPHKGDTSVDLVGTVKAIGAGLGMAHSTEASKIAADDDSEWEYEEVPEETVA